MRKLIFTLIMGSLLLCSFVVAQVTTLHSDGLTVDGSIETTSGGIIFPDGSVQTTECTTALCDLYKLTGNTMPAFCFQCSDGLDNDGDGLTDYPDDPECLSAVDDIEEAVVSKTVFITSIQYDGNFGGVAGADTVCQGHAVSAGLLGTYKAWISDSLGSDPNSTFSRSSAIYALVNGRDIAGNWADLTDGSLKWPINIDENGTDIVSGYTWTGTDISGKAVASSNCSDWRSASGGDSGGVGSASYVGPYWTAYPLYGGGNLCSTSKHLYCFEQ